MKQDKYWFNVFQNTKVYFNIQYLKVIWLQKVLRNSMLRQEWYYIVSWIPHAHVQCVCMKPIFKPKYKYNCYSATCITPNARIALLSSDKITIAAIIWGSSGSKTKRPFKQKGHVIMNWWWTGPLHIDKIEVLMLVFLYYMINFVSLICARN